MFYLETIEEGDEEEKDIVSSKMETLKRRSVPLIAITPDDTDDITESHLRHQFPDEMPLTDTEDILEEELKGATSVIDEDTDVEEFELGEDETFDSDYFETGRTEHNMDDSLDYCGMYHESFRVQDGSSKKINLIKSRSVSEYVDDLEEDQKQLTDFEDIAGSDVDFDVVKYDEDEKVLNKLLDDHNHVIDIADTIQRGVSPAPITPQLSPRWSPVQCNVKKPNRLHLAPSASSYDYMTESELLVSDSECSKKDDKKRKKLHKLKGDKRQQRKSKSLDLSVRQSCSKTHHGDSSTEDDVAHKSSSPNSNLLHPGAHVNVVFTDQEEIIISGSEREASSTPNTLQVCKDKLEEFTDVELFESDNENFIRPKSPEPSDEETGLPEPTRLMTIVKEEPSGKIVDVNFPLGDAEPDGLYNPVKDTVSDIEVFEVETNDLEEDSYSERSPTFVLNNFEGGIVESAERSIVLSPNKKQHRHDLKKDTEELECSKTDKRRKSKAKPKSVAALNIELSNLNVLTDTEELNLSDVEMPRRLSHPLITKTETDDNPLTDVDDIYFSNEEEEDVKRSRAYSLTPDFIHEFTGDTITTAKENDCPLSCEQKRQILGVEMSIPRLVRTPDIPGAQHTDTEDIIGSADEAFLETGPEIKVVEDDSFESSVHMTQSRKMDFESNEEMLHIKNDSLREFHTDVEDVEDDENRFIYDLSILEDKSKFCVCANTDEHVCICLAKPLNELTIEWQDEKGEGAEKGTQKCIVLKTTCSLNCTRQQCSKVISFQIDRSNHSLVAHQISSKDQVVMSLFYDPRDGSQLKIPYVDFCLQISSSGVRTEIKINMLKNMINSTNISCFYLHIPKQFKIEAILEENKLLKCLERKKPNYLSVRSLSGDLVLPGNITYYKDTTINVSELVSKFEFFSKKLEINENEHETSVPTDTITRRKPLVNIACLKDRSISPERLKPSSIKDSPAFKAIKKVNELKKCDNGEKIEKLGRITDKISIFERLAETSGSLLKKSTTNLRRTLSFPSRRLNNCGGKIRCELW